MLKKTTLLVFTGIVAVIFFIGLIPTFRCAIPVRSATPADWHPKSYWYYPWGKSGVHKGIDIFAKEGTEVLAATSGLVIACGHLKLGGNFVAVLGPKWRITYYAHLQKIKTKPLMWTKKGTVIGTVGTTGNAKGKPPHLHFAIVTMVPYLFNIDNTPQGWKKSFYLQPDNYFAQ